MKLNKVAMTLISAGVLLASSWSVHAALLDHTTSNQTNNINGAYFNNTFNRVNVGTGVIDPFLSIQRNETESGFNTDASPLPLNAKRATNFTDPITVGQIGTFTAGNDGFGVEGATYRQFFLDINESNNAADKYLSLNQLKIGFSSTSGALSAFPSTVAWDLDTGGDSTILLNYDLLFGSGLGFDLTFLIPESVFSGHAATDFVYLFAEFGTTGTGLDSTRDYGSSDGFEEFWALRATPLVCPDSDGCSPPPNETPEPGTLALAGLALLGVVSIRRRRQ